jgi:TPR repeat protein
LSIAPSNMQKVSILAVVAFIAMQGYAGAQSTLQKCLGIVPGRERAGILKPSAATMSYCRELPGWNLYEQAGQRFQAGDHRGAAQILEQSAQAGNPIAQLRLAMLYEAGDGVPRDLRSAFSWYRAAAQHGEPGAQFELGTYYEYGNGVIVDNWDEAAKWYRASAEQGWVKGEAGLGRAYEYGIGVPLDLGQAIAWYDKAAAKGEAKAAYFAKYLRDNHGIDGSSRDEQEQAMLGPLIKRYVMTLPPVGRTFHNHAERFAYMQWQASDEARRKQKIEYDSEKRQYDDCRNSGGSDCHPPVIAPPRE